MKKRRYSIEETVAMDQSLQHLAFYEVTKGMMPNAEIRNDPMELFDNVATQFNYYKAMIQRGSISLEQLKHDILSKNGPFFQKDEFKGLSNDEKLDKSIEMILNKEEVPEEYNLDNDPIANLLKSIFKMQAEGDYGIKPTIENKIDLNSLLMFTDQQPALPLEEAPPVLPVLPVHPVIPEANKPEPKPKKLVKKKVVKKEVKKTVSKKTGTKKTAPKKKVVKKVKKKPENKS